MVPDLTGKCPNQPARTIPQKLLPLPLGTESNPAVAVNERVEDMKENALSALLR